VLKQVFFHGPATVISNDFVSFSSETLAFSKISSFKLLFLDCALLLLQIMFAFLHTDRFKLHFPGKPGLGRGSWPIDFQFPVVLILSVLM